MDLSAAKKNNVDLYKVLGLQVSDHESLKRYDKSVITRQFRKLSLTQHPDKIKSPSPAYVRDQWDKLYAAYQILSKDKDEYDVWYIHTFLSENTALLKKLEQSEQDAAKTVSFSRLESIQNYGQTLRKLLDFQILPINWRNPYFEEPKEDEPDNSDTCLFRIKLIKREEYSTKSKLDKWFAKLDIPVTVEYYSENNDQRPDNLVVYARARNVQTTLQILELVKETKLHNDILEFESAVEYEFYSFPERVDLDPRLRNMIFNSAENPIEM